MTLDLDKGIITLYGKNSKIETFLNKLSGLSGDQVFGLFGHRGILLPREINMGALYSVLNEKVKLLFNAVVDAETRVLLENYKSLSEYQLIILFSKLCNDDDYYQYRRNLFDTILRNNVGLNLTDGELNYIKSLPTNKRRVGKFLEFEDYIFASSLDITSNIDGIRKDQFKKQLLESSNPTQFNSIAIRYEVSLENTELPQMIDEFIAKIDLLALPKSSLVRIITLDSATPLDFTLNEDTSKYARTIKAEGLEDTDSKFNELVEAYKLEHVEDLAEEEKTEEAAEVVEASAIDPVEETPTEAVEEAITEEATVEESTSDETTEAIEETPTEAVEEAPTSEEEAATANSEGDSTIVVLDSDDIENQEEVKEDIPQDNSLEESNPNEDDSNKEEALEATEEIKGDNKIALGILIFFLLAIIGIAVYALVAILK